MPWNPFKSKKKETIKHGFNPIDIDALEPVNTPARDNRTSSSASAAAEAAEASEPSTPASPTTPGMSPSVDKGYGRDALLSAAFQGDLQLLTKMLGLGAEHRLHRADSLGNTPLHLASFSGHEDAVRLLLKSSSIWHDMSGEAVPKMAGVDVGIKNGEDDTPLYMAVLSNNLEIVRLLADACGREVNLRNVEGFSPLHYSAGEGNLQITQFLVEECQADPEALDNLGLSPCFCAVLQGRVDVAKYLLQRNKKSVLSLNSVGDSMLHCALKGFENDPSMKDIVQILLEAEAPLDTKGAAPENFTCRQLMKKQGLCGKFGVDEDQPGTQPPSSAASAADTEQPAEKPATKPPAEEKPADAPSRPTRGPGVTEDCAEIALKAQNSKFFKGFLKGIEERWAKADNQESGFPIEPRVPEEILSKM